MSEGLWFLIASLLTIVLAIVLLVGAYYKYPQLVFSWIVVTGIILCKSSCQFLTRNLLFS